MLGYDFMCSSKLKNGKNHRKHSTVIINKQPRNL